MVKNTFTNREGKIDLSQQHAHIALAGDIIKLNNNYDVFLLCAPTTARPHFLQHTLLCFSPAIDKNLHRGRFIMEFMTWFVSSLGWRPISLTSTRQILFDKSWCQGMWTHPLGEVLLAGSKVAHRHTHLHTKTWHRWGEKIILKYSHRVYFFCALQDSHPGRDSQEKPRNIFVVLSLHIQLVLFDLCKMEGEKLHCCTDNKHKQGAALLPVWVRLWMFSKKDSWGIFLTLDNSLLVSFVPLHPRGWPFRSTSSYFLWDLRHSTSVSVLPQQCSGLRGLLIPTVNSTQGHRCSHTNTHLSVWVIFGGQTADEATPVTSAREQFIYLHDHIFSFLHFLRLACCIALYMSLFLSASLPCWWTQ